MNFKNWGWPVHNVLKTKGPIVNKNSLFYIIQPMKILKNVFNPFVMTEF